MPAVLEKTRKRESPKKLVDIGEFLRSSVDDGWIVRELAREIPEFLSACLKCAEDKSGNSAIRISQNTDYSIGGMMVTGAMLLHAKGMGVSIYFFPPSEQSIRRCEIVSIPDSVPIYHFI